MPKVKKNIKFSISKSNLSTDDSITLAEKWDKILSDDDNSFDFNVSLETKNGNGKRTRTTNMKRNADKKNENTKPKLVKLTTAAIEKKPARSKFTSKKKVEDTFIVSDDSSNDDSLNMYHKLISGGIKLNVKKTTPQTRLQRKRSSIPTDDGIFTPFVQKNKRIKVENNSDKENDSNELTVITRIQKPTFNARLNDTSLNEDDFDIIKRQPPKRAIEPIRVKDTSWCFSSDSDRDERLQLLYYNSEVRSPTLNTDSVNTNDATNPTLSSKTSMDTPKKKTYRKKAIPRKSVTPSPITFRLKQISKLNPKVEKKIDDTTNFLCSLSVFNGLTTVHPEAEIYKKNFKKSKNELVAKLFKIYNKEVFDDKLPFDMKIEWNVRMRSSSGFCYNKRIPGKLGPDKMCLRSSRIALSSKVLETPDRVRDTLLHELCHAASWLIDNKQDGHGPNWKKWAEKAMNRYPDLPLVTRSHDYAVETKYKYQCVKCSYTIGRHSRSLNLAKKRCGYCFGEFKLLVVQPAGKLVSPTNVKTKTPNKFALFVKDNYSKVKAEHANLKHGEIMKVLGTNFTLTKV